MAMGIVFVGMMGGIAAAIAALVIGAPFLAALMAYCMGGMLAAGLLIVVQVIRQSDLAPTLVAIAVKPSQN